jgi:S1-C subfamily serine protease
VPEPKNQPRVPAEPTYASPPRPLPSSIEETEERRPPQPATFGAFGIIVDSDETSGLLITSVKPKSLAAHIGLRSGDLIKNVAGLDVSVVEEIDSLVEVLEPEDEFEITFVRDRKSQTQAFSIPAK